MKIEILFQDDYLMVINKPSGMVVNRVETEKGETVQDWAEKRITNDELRMTNDNSTFNIQHSTFSSRFGIVHRLDKETSGCLIIAKTPEAFTELQRQFKAREVKKEYLALVHGVVEPKEGTIKVPIARSHHDRDKFAVTVGGRISETEYQVLQVFKGLARQLAGQALFDLSLLRVFPLTGRTHQIRVHFKYFGHPLVSDEKYGGKKAEDDRKWCPRIFLHAAKITFIHPAKKIPLTVESPLPEDLAVTVSQLSSPTYEIKP